MGNEPISNMIPKLHPQNRVPLVIPNRQSVISNTSPGVCTINSRIKIKIKSIYHTTPSLPRDNHRRNHLPRPFPVIRRNAKHPLRLRIRINTLLGRQKHAGIPVRIEGVEVVQG